ncbi:MAG TPA: DUF547 domain-containing protein [Candidatus Omnitrophota bacterium]|nr:DUF547 domain-containing protein [Candidatus Omnitrophota bacterium]
MSYRTLLAILSLLGMMLNHPAAEAARVVKEIFLEKPFDHSAWDEFLKKYVNEAGEVDYDGIKEDPAMLETYETQLRGFNINEFKTWPREERLALLLNAYHVGIIRVAIDHYPIKSIQDIPGVWDAQLIKIGNSDVAFSLNRLRYQELIQTFGDEKIHLALSCGAQGCPRMKREAFDGPRVEGQLFIAANEFVNNETFNRVDREKKILWLAPIFQWYGDDFFLDFGSGEPLAQRTQQESAIISFVAYYLNDAKSVEFLEANDFKIKYFVFDWSLNDGSRSSEKDVG